MGPFSNEDGHDGASTCINVDPKIPIGAPRILATFTLQYEDDDDDDDVVPASSRTNVKSLTATSDVDDDDGIAEVILPIFRRRWVGSNAHVLCAYMSHNRHNNIGEDNAGDDIFIPHSSFSSSSSPPMPMPPANPRRTLQNAQYRNAPTYSEIGVFHPA